MFALLFHSLQLVSAAWLTTPEMERGDNVSAVPMSTKSTIMGEEDMRREKVDVSFSAGTNGTVTMIVTHNGDTIVCSNLVDDVSDATEIRQSDGSFTKVHGTDGHALRSSDGGIECRVALFNERQRPYTLADVPHPPGYLSAHIILHNGEVLDVERDATTGGYVHLCPHHVPQHRRRRLQSYYEFSCKLNQLKLLKMGVVIDQAYLRAANNNRATARQKLLALFSKVSAPYERQLNVKIHVAKLLFHDDPLVQGERWARCGDPNYHLDSFTSWRKRKVPRTMAAWYFAIGCNHRAGVQGVAWLGTIGMMVSRFSNAGSTGIGFSQLVTTAHEIGHNFNAHHTFDSPHFRQKHAGNGLMDYTPSGKWRNIVQFHSMHDGEMCRSLRGMLRGGRGYVSQEEMWGATPPTPNPPRPPTPNPPRPPIPNPPRPPRPNPPRPPIPNPPRPPTPNPTTPPTPNPTRPPTPNPTTPPTPNPTRPPTPNPTTPPTPNPTRPPTPNPTTPPTPNSPRPPTPNPPTPPTPNPPTPPTPNPPTPPTSGPGPDKPTTPDAPEPGTDGEEMESEFNTTLYIILAAIAAILLLWCLQRCISEMRENARKKEREAAQTKPQAQRAPGRKRLLFSYRSVLQKREKKQGKRARGDRRSDSEGGKSLTRIEERAARKKTRSLKKKVRSSKERKASLRKRE